MNAIEGSAWHGKAKSAQLAIAGQPPIALGELEWRLSPFSLLMLKPCIVLNTHLPSQQIQADVCHSLSGNTKVNGFSLDLPVSYLQEYLPLEAKGDISVQVLSASVDSEGKIDQLDARFSWQRASAYFDGNWFVLGSFAGTAKENGSGGTAAEIFELEGPYKVELAAELSDYTEGWRVQGTIAPQQNASELIIQGLQILGEDLGNGVYRVQWP